MENNKLTIRVSEEITTWHVHDAIEIDVTEWEELNGKTEDEIKEYIKENSWNMKPPSDYSYADNLHDVLIDQDIIKDKDTGNETYIYFE